MACRTIALLAISSIVFLVSAIHGNAYGGLITSDNGLNSDQVLRYYTAANLIDNQSSNREIMNVLKSQLEDSDPFKTQSSNNVDNALNLSSTEDSGPFDRRSNDVNANDVNANDVNANDVNANDGKGCEFNCVESTTMRDNIPFELPSIPFP